MGSPVMIDVGPTCRYKRHDPSHPAQVPAGRMNEDPLADERIDVAKRIDVVGAVIVSDEMVLCAQRGPQGHLAGLWEFPGGKIEPGETPQAALEREIAEELDCRVNVGAELTTTIYEYDFGVVTLTTFWCQLIDGVPRLLQHAEVRWCPTSDLEALDWAPADVPAMRMIVAGSSADFLRS